MSLANIWYTVRGAITEMRLVYSLFSILVLGDKRPVFIIMLMLQFLLYAYVVPGFGL